MSPEPGDPYEELARELRRGVGEEWRDEAELVEHETHVGRLRRRTLSDTATEAMHRGDRVRAFVGDLTVTGAIMFAGRDYVVIRSEHQIVDIPLERAVLRVERTTGGGHSTRGGSATFRARLSEYEHTGEPVTLHLSGAAPSVTGRIEVAAVDHCVVTDADGSAHVPIAAIAMISRPVG